MAMTGEHAEDVLGQLSVWLTSKQDCALVIVTSTEGGAVRAPGALMAVGFENSLGYISGGCIDADVKLQARQACLEGTVRSLRYGAGSPFVDLPLPCGGAIDILVIPNPELTTIADAHEALVTRAQVSLYVSNNGALKIGEGDNKEAGSTYHYLPKLRLRIAGRGADALALAKISDAAGYQTHLQLLDDDDIYEAQRADLTDIQKLSVTSDLQGKSDDPWTAFILLFHDQNWEVPLLQQALEGPAFYVGAVGSKRTHANRCEALRLAGTREKDIARIHGPIGLVPSLRDASLLAVSTLAEIIGAFPIVEATRVPNTALLLLAAGASSRFEDGDKLLARLNGKTVLEHAARLSLGPSSTPRVAVTPSGAPSRTTILRSAGWDTFENPDADLGQSTSLSRGIEHILKAPETEQVILLLGDMPYVPASHLEAIQALAEQDQVTAIMSDCDGVLCPPALFKRKHFQALTEVTGDRGAKSVFLALTDGALTIPLSTQHGKDIDRVADLKEPSEIEHA